MTGTPGTAVPLARLVVFMLCLSIAGAFVAGLHYYAVDLPQQNAVQAPQNAGSMDVVAMCMVAVQDCRDNCHLTADRYKCYYYCDCYWNACLSNDDSTIKMKMHDCAMQGVSMGYYVPTIPSIYGV